VIYTIILSNVIGKIFSKTSIAKQGWATLIFVSLLTYYVSTFIHVAGRGIFFLNILGMSLGINILLCLLISKVITWRLAKKC
jgi:hypothetical protein